MIQKRYPVNPGGHPTRLVILLVGCGGTGSWAAHVLAQFAVWARDKSIGVDMYFIDPDSVETKNLVRQNFCQAEVGYPKAFTLAWRFNAAFGLQITPVVRKFEAAMLSEYRPRLVSGDKTLTLIVGAVDNTAARQEIASALTERLADGWSRSRWWWIDAGNERNTGQVLIGNSMSPEPLLSPLGYCTALPFPHIQEPSLLTRAAAGNDAADLSCADLTLQESQSAVINRQMAAWIGVYLYRLLQKQDLDIMATWLDLTTGQARSVSITSGQLLKPRRLSPVPGPAGRDEAWLIEQARDEAHRLEEVTCPECNNIGLVSGTTNVAGVEIAVRFCTHCDFREEGCPNCWGELEETVRLNVNGDPVPILRCLDCDWQHDAEA